jgi:hypothetical protein
MRINGVFNAIDIEAKVEHAVHFQAEVNDEPSSYGICDGRIPKLQMEIDGEVVCNYNRGWDIRPTCSAAEVILKSLLYIYDDRSLDAQILYED